MNHDDEVRPSDGEREPAGEVLRVKKRCLVCGQEFEADVEFCDHKCPGLRNETQNIQPATVERDLGRGLLAVLKFGYTQNPFYLISACLVLYGLNIVFRTSDYSANGWTLLTVLAGYTTLMAIVGVLIVRTGKVWEDARSIILVVVLLFIALSMSFDEIVMLRPSEAMPLLLVGLGFAIVLSAGMARGLRIRLPLLFRIPYHVILSTLFLYPMFLLPLVRRGISTEIDDVSWGILSFPVAIAAGLLLLLPAARRGRRYVRRSGTPWQWPWYPWGFFAALVAGACFRTYSLTLSFYPIAGMDSPFGLYFLVPVFLAIAVLVLEAGLASRKSRLQELALFIPLVAVFVSCPSSSANPAYRAFLRLVVINLGPPAQLASVLAAGFYLYARLRGVRLAEAGLAVSLLLAAVVGDPVVDSSLLVLPRVETLLALVLVLIWFAFQTRRSWWAVLAAATCLYGITSDLRGTWFTAAHAAIPLHLGYATLLVIGVCFRDRFARFLQYAAAPVLPFLFVAALFFREQLAPQCPEWGWGVYIAVMLILGFAYWALAGNALYLYAGLLNLSVLGLYVVAFAYAYFSHPHLPRGVITVFWGGLSFVVAVLISFIKAGIVQNVLRQLGTLSAETGNVALRRS